MHHNRKNINMSNSQNMTANIRNILVFLSFLSILPSTFSQGPGGSPSTSPDMSNLAILEPLDGQHYLGPWLDMSEGHDTPSAFNARLGRNASFFHFAQNIPETDSAYPPFELLDQTATDAILYLSVLPTRGYRAIQQKDLQYLVDRCRGFNERGRKVFLRFAPGELSTCSLCMIVGHMVPSNFFCADRIASNRIQWRMEAMGPTTP